MAETAREGSLEVDAERRGGALVLRLRGELSVTTAHQLLLALEDGRSPGVAGVVLDGTELTFLDSSGLGAVIGLQRRLKAEGIPLALAAFVGAPRKVLKLTHLHLVLGLYDSVQKAEQAVLERTGR